MDIPLQSSISGVGWPPIPNSHASTLLAYLFEIETSQWWSPQRIREKQFMQIRILLQHCVRNVPYYMKDEYKKFLAAGGGEDEWLKLPILTRDKVQSSAEQLNARGYPKDHGKAMLQRTSGSTGKPVEVLGTELTRFLWRAHTLRDHFWHKRDFAGKLCVIRFSTDEKTSQQGGLKSDNWGMATGGLFRTGPCVMRNIFTPISELAKWLERENPQYLLTHPSVLQALALYCEDSGIALPALKEVRTISEALPDGLHALVEKVWAGVKLVDVYSSIELGYLALQCPDSGHYHVQAEGVLLEVIGDDGLPCKPGQVGRVVITNLHNFATPLVRYEVGDYAEVGEPCPCGRGLPVIKRIYGRYRNLIVLPNGERCWPRFGMGEVMKVAPVKQFQAIQHSEHKVEFRLVTSSTLDSQQLEKLNGLFTSHLHPDMEVVISEVESIPRSPSGKYEEFVSMLN